MTLRKAILVAVACAALGFGQAGQDQKPSEEKAAKADATKPEPGGKSEGIKVHGHWMLEVRNPDGTLASRREFENSLNGASNGGSGGLARLLSGAGAVSSWVVTLGYETSSNSGCGVSNNCPVLAIGQSAYCPAPSVTIVSCTPSLTLVLGNAGTQIVFQGTTAPVAEAITIPSVATQLYICNPGLTVAACQTAQLQGYYFTSASTNTSVQAGQTVMVTVVLSFS